jgi:hypothetical protein
MEFVRMALARKISRIVREEGRGKIEGGRGKERMIWSKRCLDRSSWQQVDRFIFKIRSCNSIFVHNAISSKFTNPISPPRSSL